MKTYDYLIAYTFSSKEYLTPCTGTIQASLAKKIETFEDINEISKDIAERIEGATNVSIYNFILLGQNKH